MTEIKDLNSLGQDKSKAVLDLKLPSPSDRPLTVKEFSEYSMHNLGQIGNLLKGILEFNKGQNNVNEVYKQRLDSIELVLDAWIKEAKALEEKENNKNDQIPTGEKRDSKKK